MLTIAVDAMGGDYAPKSEIEGSILAAQELNISVVQVGQEDVLRRRLKLHPEAGRMGFSDAGD
jgi:glycerol-3-phosphate acyltransferase PlsX